MAFSFSPSSYDGTSELLDETSIQATIDGQVETLDEPGGTSYSQVASDLYNLLVQAGLTGVSLDNNEVIVTNDFSGQPVNSIQLDATDTSGNSMNGINMGVDTLQPGSSTSTYVSSSTNPALPGQPVTLTAAVTGSGVTPTGTVTFQDGNTTLGTGTLDANGNATFTSSTLPLGSNNITAVYGGDDNYSGSSGTFTQVISQESPNSSSLTSSLNPASTGQAITFTSTVSGTNGTPTGSVAFYDGTNLLGSGTLMPIDGQAQATFTTSTLCSGSHNIVAVYGGDGTYGSSSSSLTQSVNTTSQPTVTRISPTAGSIAGGTTVTISGTGFTGATAVDFGAIGGRFTVNPDSFVTAYVHSCWCAA